MITSRAPSSAAAALLSLPGIGRYTAGAIASFAFEQPAAIVEANTLRLYCRLIGYDGDPRSSAGQQALWAFAESLISASRERQRPESAPEDTPVTDAPGSPATINQALMDLGATVCTRKPDCGACPVRTDCVARKTGRIAELPAPRPRKALPLRKATWFVYRNNGRVLLERRPAPGIWGGLWCFPEKNVLKAHAARRLPPIDHGFTHFRLRIQPLLHEVKRAPGALWIDLDDALHAAVPAPVKKLLATLRSAGSAR